MNILFLGNLGTGEIVIIALIVLIVLGIKKALFSRKNIKFVDAETNEIKTVSASKNVINRNNLVSEMYQGLNIQQRYTVMSLLFFFQGFSMGKPNAGEANKIVFFMADSLGVTIQQAMSYAEAYNSDADKLICNLKTITDRGVLDSVLYNCFGLSKISGKDDAFEALVGIFTELGYTQGDIMKTIEKIDALGRMCYS